MSPTFTTARIRFAWVDAEIEARMEGVPYTRIEYMYNYMSGELRVVQDNSPFNGH
jgi:hypothetical protein